MTAFLRHPLLLYVFLIPLVQVQASHHRHVPRQAPGVYMQTQASVGIDDGGEIDYSVNITLGGRPFTVVLDTGSTDVWVYDPTHSLKIVNDSGIVANISYGKGFVKGPVQFAELQLGPYTVASQAFINVNETRDIDGTDGILGMSFDGLMASSIYDALSSQWGNGTALAMSFTSNLLTHNGSLQTFFDIALGRSGDLDNVSEGTLLIGQHDATYAQVDGAPKLPQALPAHWSVFVEGAAVNGKNFTFGKSLYGKSPPGQLVGFVDTGTSLSQVSDELMDFIYGDIPGALKDDDGTWYLPCQSSANLTWTIGGQTFPVHPLDLSLMHNVTLTSNLTITVCQGAYTGGPPLYPGVDIVLGDSFLRNVYTSFNFGNDTDRDGLGGSYIQFLSTTKPDQAWAEFKQARQELAVQAPYFADPFVYQNLPKQCTEAIDLDSPTSSAPSATARPIISSSFTISRTSSATAQPTDSASVVQSIRPLAPSASSSVASSPSPTPANTSNGAQDTSVRGALADLESESDDSSGVASILNKYGPIVLGLLAGNLLVMVLLCFLGLVICMQGVVRRGAQSRSVSSSYAPVKVKDQTAYDEEFNPPVTHNYAE